MRYNNCLIYKNFWNFPKKYIFVIIRQFTWLPCNKYASYFPSWRRFCFHIFLELYIKFRPDFIYISYLPLSQLILLSFAFRFTRTNKIFCLMRCSVKFPVPFEVEGGGANVASELAVVVVRSKMFLQRNPKRKLSLAHRTWIRTLN